MRLEDEHLETVFLRKLVVGNRAKTLPELRYAVQKAFGPNWLVLHYQKK